jgi:hypothetical protein
MSLQSLNDVIICIGNGGQEADRSTNSIASNHNVAYHGFLNNDTEIKNGCYHTSIYDITLQELVDKVAGITKLKIILLDQDESYYNNLEEFYSTIDLAQVFVGRAEVEFLNKSWSNPFRQIIKDNKSFCVLPFMTEYISQGNIKHCCRQDSFSQPYTDFFTNAESVEMRKKLIAGERIEICHRCYNLEDHNMVSIRQKETVSWANKLNFKSIQDVVDNMALLNYEVQVGNKCNLMCRMCGPFNSNLIADEYYKIGLDSQDLKILPAGDFDRINLDTVQRVFVSGGEPSISNDFYNFLKKCIQQNKTDFEISLSTNAISLPKEFVALIRQFKNIKIGISVDGFDQINQYIRWPSDWKKFTKNIDRLRSALLPYNYHFNTTVSIYNITRLYAIFEYLEINFPGINLSMNILEHPEIQQPWNFPNKQLALDHLYQIKNLQTYRKNEIFRSKIDGIIARMQQSTVDMTLLAQFFRFNDQLDLSRNVKLSDYIPELDACRSYLAG